MGISITTSNYETLKLCMNPSFNPDSPGLVAKPMVAANSDGSCPTITHTGTECFSITNTTTTDPFGKHNKVEQIFKMVANSAVSYYAAVNAFDLGTISTNVGAFAHLNNWDCTASSGGFSEISFVTAPTAAQLTALMSAMRECSSLETRARGNSGMGGYNCTGGDQNKIVSKTAERGVETGKYGGEMAVTTNTCGTGGTANSAIPNRLFLEQQDSSLNLYCMPSAGACASFNINENPVNVAAKSITHGDFTMQSIQFTLVNNRSTGGTITYSGPNGNCTATFTNNQHQFTPVTAPTQANQFPKECVEKGLTDMGKCGEYCDPKKGHTCTPPS
jgi:hypothetical protein